MWLIVAMFFTPFGVFAQRGSFDVERWYSMLDDVRTRATAEKISDDVISDVLRAPAFIPSIVKSDKNQAEFKLTLNGYLDKTVNV